MDKNDVVVSDSSALTEHEQHQGSLKSSEAMNGDAQKVLDGAAKAANEDDVQPDYSEKAKNRTTFSHYFVGVLLPIRQDKF